MTTNLTFRYPWDKGRVGLFVGGAVLVVWCVYLWDILVRHPIGYAFILIALIGVILNGRALHATIFKAPEKLTIKGTILIAQFANGRTEEVDIRSINRIVEHSSALWLSQFSIRLIADSEDREILVGRYLIGLTQLINTIQTINPACTAEHR